jgi:hypothetical protein
VSLKPRRCHRTTVSGRTTCKDLRQFFQSLANTIQKIRSISVSRGRGWRAFHTASCCLSARFSSANSRRVRTAERNVRRRIPSHLTTTGHIADHFAQRKIVATDEFLEGTGHLVRPQPFYKTKLGKAYLGDSLSLMSTMPDQIGGPSRYLSAVSSDFPKEETV